MSNCIIFGLTDIGALFANEARFFRFRVFFRACSLLNEVGEPPFFYISDRTNSSTLSGKSQKKNQCWKIFVRTSLNCGFRSRIKSNSSIGQSSIPQLFLRTENICARSVNALVVD